MHSVGLPLSASAVSASQPVAVPSAHASIPFNPTSVQSRHGYSNAAARRTQAMLASSEHTIVPPTSELNEEFRGEFESCSTTSVKPPPVYVHGRLKAHSVWWKQHADSMVYDWVCTGYKPLFETSEPPHFFFDNHNSAYKAGDFVDSAIQSLIATGAAVPWSGPLSELHVSPLGVVTRNNKNRLICDLSFFNQYLVIPPFKYEGLDVASIVLQPNDFMVVRDLKVAIITLIFILTT